MRLWWPGVAERQKEPEDPGGKATVDAAVGRGTISPAYGTRESRVVRQSKVEGQPCTWAIDGDFGMVGWGKEENSIVHQGEILEFIGE